MKKQKKFIIIIIFAIVIFLIVTSMNLRISSGYKIYGNEYCNTNHHLQGSGDAFTDWTCGLCGKSATEPTTDVPEICIMCSFLTGRCNECGKLKSN